MHSGWWWRLPRETNALSDLLHINYSCEIYFGLIPLPIPQWIARNSNAISPIVFVHVFLQMQRRQYPGMRRMASHPNLPYCKFKYYIVESRSRLVQTSSHSSFLTGVSESTRATWHVSTLLGLIRRAYWWGDMIGNCIWIIYKHNVYKHTQVLVYQKK